MASKAQTRERWSLIAIRAWAIIGVLLLLTALGWLLSAVSAALVPFALGLVIVLLLRRPVALLSKKMPRIVAVLVCYVAVVVVLALALTFIIPPVFAQISQFVRALPGYAQQAFKLWDTYVAHPTKGSGVPEWLQASVIALKDQLVASAGTWSSAIAQTAVSAGSSIATGVFSLIIALVVGSYTLSDLPSLEREVFLVAGERAREELTRAAGTITRVLGGWLRGALIQSTVVAVLYSIVLAVVGVPYALAIGVIGGMLNVVPYVGPFITLALAAGAGLFISPSTALWALLGGVAVQQLDTLVMAPRIMSKQVDLHPLMVIFAFLVGVTLFGVPGLVLAVPVTAVIKGLFVYWFEKRTERQITTEDGVFFRTPKDEGEGEDAEPAAGKAE
jgi:predicted PurR-regulated permease PerM